MIDEHEQVAAAHEGDDGRRLGGRWRRDWGLHDRRDPDGRSPTFASHRG
jgi:hypothetical protein